MVTELMASVSFSTRSVAIEKSAWQCRRYRRCTSPNSAVDNKTELTYRKLLFLLYLSSHHSFNFYFYQPFLSIIFSFIKFSRGRRGQEGHNTRSLPRHFKLSAHSPAAALAYYDSTKDKLLVTKSISLICQQPYLHAAKVFLKNLYKWVIIPLHYISNLYYNMVLSYFGFTLFSLFFI